MGSNAAVGGPKVPQPPAKGNLLPAVQIPPVAKGNAIPLPMPAVKVKPVVPLPVPDIPEPAPVAGVGRSVVLYRGDSRDAGTIKQYGFELWGASIANVSKAGGIANYIGEMCKSRLNGKTVADFVRVSKNQDRPTVSTSFNEGCGGYDSGNIYKIEVSGLHEFDLDTKIMPASFAGMKWASDGLKVYMNGQTLATSRIIVIDLRLGTQEWAFFSKVPTANITEYKLKGGKAFQPMSGVQATVKKLW
jgi:hypothetical protein